MPSQTHAAANMTSLSAIDGNTSYHSIESLSLQVTNRKKRVLVDDEDSEDDEGMVFFPEGNSNEVNSEAAANARTESSHDLD